MTGRPVAALTTILFVLIWSVSNGGCLARDQERHIELYAENTTWEAIRVVVLLDGIEYLHANFTGGEPAEVSTSDVLTWQDDTVHVTAVDFTGDRKVERALALGASNHILIEFRESEVTVDNHERPIAFE